MTYLAGIDGGGSRTRCIIGDGNGNILAEGFSGGSNYKTIGEEAAKAAVTEALTQAAGKLGIELRDITYAVFGLCGDDCKKDHDVLEGICAGILGHEHFEVINNAWIALRAGTKNNIGIITICGAGSACAGRNANGESLILRNMTYELGNPGGGMYISHLALHNAFRSDEKTGEKTHLEKEIPRLFGTESLDGIIKYLSMIMPERLHVYKGDDDHHFTKEGEKTGEEVLQLIYDIPILVCRLAEKGDRVCQDILLRVGRELGEIACGVIQRLDMSAQECTVCLMGGVLYSDNPLLVDEYTTTVHRIAPRARITVSRQRPVYGAYCLALDEYKKIASQASAL